MTDKFQLIKVEAVNIYASVYDTEQLSVIRGSSFLLKKAIIDISEKFKGKIDPVSTGASSGLFSVKDNADSLVEDITKYLNDNKKKYRYFTFVVEYVKDVEDTSFQDAKEALVAKQRFSQLQSLTIAPDPQCENENTQPCEMQGVRVCDKKYYLTVDGNKVFVSKSVYDRFSVGRENRSALYKSEIGDSINDDFTSDLQTLASSDKYKKLNDKIAVIYFDGNRFSSILRSKVKDIEGQKDFDNKIQGYRKEFLGNLLKKFSPDNNDTPFINARTDKDKDKDKGECRLETLLWGGDEMVFVVPAWLGFDVLNFFYKESRDWEYVSIPYKPAPLKHAGGIVFCSAKTPISKIRYVAQSLADEIKEKEGGRNENYFDYIVLESIDYPVESTMNEFFKNMYGDISDSRYFISPCYTWGDKVGIKDQLKSILSKTPKGQIYKISNLIINNADKETIDKAIKRLSSLMGDNNLYEELESTLDALFNPPDIKDNEFNPSWKWVHLVELWDYLVPELKEDAQPSEAEGAHND